METVQKVIEAQEIYKPPGSFTLDSQDVNFQVRLSIQGEGGTGKSYALTSFTNPIFLSFDRGLVSHIGRTDIIEVPFYDGKFVDTIVKRDGILCPPNRKDALIKWLSTEGLKLKRNQMCMFDANTGIQSSYHTWWEQYKEQIGVTNDGRIDSRREWRLKINFYTEVMTLMKELKCDVGFVFHESPDRDDKGNLTGAVRPLVTGQFQDEAMTHFTDWFRAWAVAKPRTPEAVSKFKEAWRIDDATLKEWMASTENTHETIYLWQTASDSKAKCKTSLMSPPKFIVANATSFNKYKRIDNGKQ